MPLIAVWMLIAAPPSVAAQESHLAGAGLAPRSDSVHDLLSPREPADLHAVSAVIRRLVGESATPQELPATLSGWRALGRAAGVRVAYLGRRVADEIELSVRPTPDDSSPAEREMAIAVATAAHAQGLEVRAVADDVLVFADLNLGYRARLSDFPILEALASGTSEALAAALAENVEHPLAVELSARLAEEGRQFLYAADDAATFDEAWENWSRFLSGDEQESVRERAQTFALCAAFGSADIKDLFDLAAADDTDASVARIAATLAERFMAEAEGYTGLDEREEQAVDEWLAHDIEFWMSHGGSIAELASREPLPVEYWRLRAYGKTEAPDVLAEQVDAFGNDQRLRDVFDSLDVMHVAALLKDGHWRPTHELAIGWLADRLIDRDRMRPLSRANRELLAQAARDPAAQGGAVADALIERLVIPLRLIEAAPMLASAAKAGSVRAVEALAELLPAVAARKAVAAYLLASSFIIDDESLFDATLQLAIQGLDAAAAEPLYEIAVSADLPVSHRSAALRALFQLAPDRAVAAAQAGEGANRSLDLPTSTLVEFLRTPPGVAGPNDATALSDGVPSSESSRGSLHEYVVALAASLAAGEIADRTIARDHMLADWPKAVAIENVAEVRSSVLSELLRTLERHDFFPYVVRPGDESLADLFPRRIVLGPWDDDDAAFGPRLSNLARSLIREIELRLHVHDSPPILTVPVEWPSFILHRAVDHSAAWYAQWSSAFDTFAIAAKAHAESAPGDAPVPAPAGEATPGALPVAGEASPGVLPADSPEFVERRRPRRDAAHRLLTHLSVGATRFREESPVPVQEASFAQGARVALAISAEFDALLPPTFRIVLEAGGAWSHLGTERWRVQTNTLSVYEAFGGLGVLYDLTAPAQPHDWSLRVGLLPHFSWQYVSRSDVNVRGELQGVQSESRSYVLVRARLAIRNDELFGAGSVVGVFAAGDAIVGFGTGLVFGYEWFAGLTWRVNETFALTLACENRFERRHAESNRHADTNAFGGRLSLTVSF